ncbi:MAG: SHOCT domain-containing protein [Chlorobiaceae bacterium]|nr:SHOCT domain-containing protein [Chlorobiaceae bacterium]
MFRVIIANESDTKRLAYHYNPQFLVKKDSVSDEIQKLGDLRRQGLLTEEEFEQRKEKLLN